MTSAGVDARIVAERVAEVVNKKLAEVYRKIGAIESRLTKLELDVVALRSQTIESIVRSVLTIKVEDIASAIAVKVASEFREPIREVVAVAEKLRGTAEHLSGVAEELSELKELPEKVAEVIKSSVPEQLTSEKLEEVVSSAVEPVAERVEDLTKRIGEMMKLVAIAINKTDDVAEQLKAVASKFSEIKESVDELRESISYVSEVSRLLEERLKGRRGSEEVEEEGEGEEE